MSERYDAAVIGGGISGLGAAALLGKSGLRTVLLEQAASHTASGAALRALDPRLVKELKLAKYGLKFALRDLTLTLLRAGGQPIALTRDRHANARSLAALSPADAAAFTEFQRERLALARALRLSWWEGRPASETIASLKAPQRDLVDRLSVTSASCWLASRFESDALKAALAFEAASCGFAPSEPGSALALLWSAAQEMCGLQGAVAIPRGGEGAVVQALAEAATAAGAEIRLGATVSRLRVDGLGILGLELAAGGELDVPLVLSTLSRARTLEGLAPIASLGLGAPRHASRPRPVVGAATLVFGLNRMPDLGGPLSQRRVVVAEKLEIYEAAFAAARLGRRPAEPVLELILPPAEGTAAQLASRLQLFVRAWPLPAEFDRAALSATVTAMLERHIPGFAAASCDVLALEPQAPSVERLLAGAAERIETQVRGLYLCGGEAEPADATSGRAARLAARAAFASHRGGHR